VVPSAQKKRGGVFRFDASSELRAADEGAEDTRKPARQDPGADQDAGREVGPAQGPDESCGESWTMCAKASFVEATEELGLALDCCNVRGLLDL
jgi:hypothetical protein